MRVGFLRLPHDFAVCVNFIYNYKGTSLTIRQWALAPNILLCVWVRYKSILIARRFQCLSASGKGEYFRGGLGLDIGLTVPISTQFA